MSAPSRVFRTDLARGLRLYAGSWILAGLLFYALVHRLSSGFLGGGVGVFIGLLLNRNSTAIRVTDGVVSGRRFWSNVEFRLADVDLARTFARRPLRAKLSTESIWSTQGQRIDLPVALTPADRKELLGILRSHAVGRVDEERPMPWTLP